MAKDTLPEERTEMPTERRLQDIRKEGAIFHSVDLEHTLVLVAGFVVVSYTWNVLYQDMRYMLVRSFRMIGESPQLSANDLVNGFARVCLLLLPDILVITGVVGFVAALSVFLQTNWNRRDKLIKFRWDFINPLKGLKRIISIHGLVNVLKAIAKMTLALPIGYWALKGLVPEMVRLVHMSITDVLALTGTAMTGVFWKVMYAFFIIAAFDIVWGRLQWLKQNKMTKEEVKDERKSMEGDESMRRKMIAKGQQRLVNKLKSSVPKADVVVTNPTHYAVALKYDRENFAAPIVVAKGTDFMAQRIREIAAENNLSLIHI